MRRLQWTIIIIGALAALLVLVLDDGEPVPPPPTAAAPQADPPEREASARAERRRLRALMDLLDRRREPTRAIKVRVVDCGLAPAAFAEVSVSAGAEIVKGLADELGVFRAQIPEDATTATAIARVDDTLGARDGIAAGAADLDVVVCPGATVEGVVRDPAGRTLRDAVVRFGDGEDVAVTDDDGEFVLTDSYLTANRVVVQHALGLAEVVLETPLGARERRVIEVVISDQRRVSGVVVDRHGALAPNVPIVAIDARAVVVARASSDRNGRFWLKKLPVGALLIRADGGAAGLAEVALGEHAQDDAMVLRLGADRASLTVFWEGAAQGTISVSVAGIGDGADPIVPGDFVVASGEERWVATPAVYRVWVQTADAGIDCGEVFLFGGERKVVRCGKTSPARLVGRVIGPDGRPRPNTSFTAYVMDTRAVIEGTSDSSGRIVASFVIDRATRARIDVGRPEPDVDMLSRRNIMLAPGETTDLGDLQLRGVDDVRAMFTERETGTFGGLGGMLAADRMGVAFSRVIRGGPLDRAGVRPGDVVIDIDGKSAGQLTEREVTLRLRGQPGSPVSLRLLRPGEGQLDVELERALIDPGSGWVD